MVQRFRPARWVLVGLLTLTACGQVDGVTQPGGAQPPADPGATPYPTDPGTDPYPSDPYPTYPQDPYPTPSPIAGDIDPKTLVNPYDPSVGLGGVPSEDLDNFQIVDQGLYRGARPSRQGLQTLRRLGIRTIVTFEKDKDAVAAEQSYGQQLGMKVVNIPLGVVLAPSDDKVNQFLSLAQSPAERPLYFHCKQGRDRTGALALAYRVRVQHWQPEYALAEMQQHGFHNSLLGLKWWAKRYAKGHYTPAPQPVFPGPSAPPGGGYDPGYGGGNGYDPGYGGGNGYDPGYGGGNGYDPGYGGGNGYDPGYGGGNGYDPGYGGGYAGGSTGGYGSYALPTRR